MNESEPSEVRSLLDGLIVPVDEQRQIPVVLTNEEFKAGLITSFLQAKVDLDYPGLDVTVSENVQLGGPYEFETFNEVTGEDVKDSIQVSRLRITATKIYHLIRKI